MGWSGSLSSSSAVGASITFTPGTTTEGAYVVGSFTAPKKGIYRFTLKGSGGTNGLDYYENASVGGNNYNQWAGGGAGGKTVGYLLLEAGQTVYVGAGGTCCAAFVSSANGSALSAISASKLYFVAGGGGAGGSFGESYNNTGWNCRATAGGNGGGSVGADATDEGGGGGTQSAGGTAKSDGFAGGDGAYGTGGGRWRAWDGTYVAISGRGGDGYYGGAGGHGSATNSGSRSARGYGGGGGSGYIKTSTLTVSGKTYTNTTTQGGGAAGGSEGYYSWGNLSGSQFAGESGSVEVTYYARAELPIKFNGSTVERLIFNGTEVTSLVYNGMKIFCERLKRRVARCYTLTKTASRLRIPI